MVCERAAAILSCTSTCRTARGCGHPGRPRAGFVVSKAVGGSVVRHAVVRRLRPLVAERLSALPPGSRVVLRALPAAAAATSAMLARDLDAALDKALQRARDRVRGESETQR